jgi:hypothetical protein
MWNRALVIAAFVTALVMPAFGQTPSGEISGTVLDSSGSVLPGVMYISLIFIQPH